MSLGELHIIEVLWLQLRQAPEELQDSAGW